MDICDKSAIQKLFSDFQPDIIMHLAAESHVDRSIDGPAEFIQTNVVGTLVLLDEARNYWQSLEGTKKEQFRFHHVSTDEVYGENVLEEDEANNDDEVGFHEQSGRNMNVFVCFD